MSLTSQVPSTNTAREKPASGYLSAALHKLYKDALTHTLKSCTYAHFSACFPTPSQKRPEVLKSVWTQVLGKVESKALAEYEVILQERDVVAGLERFERVLAAARARREQNEKNAGAEGENVA
jgi:kinetochore protein NNF1